MKEIEATLKTLLESRLGNRGRARVYAMAVAHDCTEVTEGKTQKKLAKELKLTPQTFNEMVWDYKVKLGHKKPEPAPLKYTYETLKELFTVDTNKGLVYRKKTGRLVGAEEKNNGTIKVYVTNRVYATAHRIIASLYYGELITEQILHLNGDNRDNRIENLTFKGIDKYEKKTKEPSSINTECNQREKRGVIHEVTKRLVTQEELTKLTDFKVKGVWYEVEATN